MIPEEPTQSMSQQTYLLSPEGGLSFIEQLQNCSVEKCSKDSRPYLVGVNEEHSQVILTRPACKQWNCEACAARNAKLWIARIINGVNKIGGDWHFLTLTASAKNRGMKSVPNLRDGWDRFYTCINALFSHDGETPHYAKVWEQHADGSFHIHALLDVIMSKRWTKDTAVAAGLGHQADWHTVDNAGQIAGYIAKYSLKNATVARGGILWPKSLRRVETSRNWPKLPRLEANSQWAWIVKMTRDEQIASAGRFHLRGFDILDQTKENDV